MKKAMKFEIEILDNKTKESFMWFRKYTTWNYAERFAQRQVRFLQSLESLSDDYQFTVTRIPDSSIVFTD